MNFTHKISVIIPAFNAAAFIEEAIVSIQQQKGSFETEIIVVDDGSEDRTIDICQSLNVKVIRQEHSGVATARNRGVEMASGEFITFLDADDLWNPNKLEKQIAVICDNPSVSVVLGLSLPVNQELVPLSEPMFLLHLGASLTRKEAFLAIGEFNTSLEFGEDADWFIRMMELQLEVMVTQNVVQKIRRHNHNMTKDREKANQFLVKALRMSLERRREKNNGEVTELSQLNIPDTAYSPSKK